DPGNQGARDNIQRAQAKLAAARAAPASPAGSPAPGGPTARPTAPAPGEPAHAAAPAPSSAPDPAAAEKLARADYEQAVGMISQRRYADSVTALNAALQLEPGLAVAYV